MRISKLLSARDGIATPVLAAFMMVTMFFVFGAFSLISEVENDRAVAKAALDVALRSAAANGTGIVPGTTLVVWNDSTALSAAEQAIPMALPVALAGSSGSGATFTPDSNAPRNWGTVSLTQFATGTGPPPSCSGGLPESAPSQSWVSASLTIPLTIGFAGVAFHLDVTACGSEVANTYNGSQFNVP